MVTAGCGWGQREGGPVEEIHPGDVVWFSPGEKHWHGATPTTAMTHIAVQEKKTARWSTGWTRSPTSNTATKWETIAWRIGGASNASRHRQALAWNIETAEDSSR